MLGNKFRKAGLGSFNYKATAWYKTILGEGRVYKIKVMMFGLICVSALLSVFLVACFVEHIEGPIPVYISGICFFLLNVFMLKQFHELKPVRRLFLLEALVGLVLSLYMPGGRNLYLLVVTCTPIAALQLYGTRRGVWWSLVVLSIFIVSGLGSLTGLLPRWQPDLSLIEFLTITGAATLVFGLGYLDERRYETMIGRLTDMLVFDETTGLPNRDVLAHSIRSDCNYILGIIKIENFSDLVALFGYEFSDTISQFASQKLRKYEHLKHYRAFQLKYNEYAILISSPEPLSVVDAAQQLSDIVKSLELESLPWQADKVKLVYCVGGTVVDPDDTRSPLSKADIALKKAENGHTLITIFNDDKDERESAYNYLMRFTELIDNRDNKTLKAVFQPIFSSDGVSIAWYEALLRIKRKDGTYSSIFPYLAVARSTGLYPFLTDFIVRKAAEEIVTHDVDISINISIHDIVRPEFIMMVDEVYEQIRAKKGRIIFEILESDELVELDKCLWFIDYITRYGFRIAIDDFGSGYSNYCSLINLPIDIVKIDGSLIKKIKTDENARVLVEGIVHFCRKSNKKTVAEYVEDIMVYDSLRSMNIDYLQGYYLSEPAQIAECPRPSVF